MACMYFIEPVNMPFVYSENFQQFVSIFSLGNARYQVTFPDKSCSYYQYKDGLLVQLEVNNEWANLTFKLIEEKFEAVR